MQAGGGEGNVHNSMFDLPGSSWKHALTRGSARDRTLAGQRGGAAVRHRVFVADLRFSGPSFAFCDITTFKFARHNEAILGNLVWQQSSKFRNCFIKFKPRAEIRIQYLRVWPRKPRATSEDAVLAQCCYLWRHAHGMCICPGAVASCEFICPGALA